LRHVATIDPAPASSLRTFTPASAEGSRPTGVSTEKRPPTLGGMEKIAKP